VAGEKVERFLLIAGEELGSDEGDGHDLGTWAVLSCAWTSSLCPSAWSSSSKKQ